MNPICKTIYNSIGEANGSVEFSKLFFEKYRSLYNSVPTSVDELSSLRDVMNRTINVFVKGTLTSEIVKMYIGKLNSGKDDDDIGFKSDHIINGTHRLNVLLSLLFNSMISHGYTPTVLLKSTIVSIPKDNKASLSNSDNYRGISLFNSIYKLFDHVILYLYKDQFQSSDMQFGYKNETLQRCVLWFIKKLFLIMLTIIQVYIVVC